jgi:hypothetical protein
MEQGRGRRWADILAEVEIMIDELWQKSVEHNRIYQRVIFTCRSVSDFTGSLRVAGRGIGARDGNTVSLSDSSETPNNGIICQ